MLGGTFSPICFLLNALFFLLFAVCIVIAKTGPVLCHFNLEKHHLQLSFSFLTGVDVFHWLFLRFLKSKYVHCISLLSWQGQKKNNCYIYVSTLNTENIRGTLFVVQNINRTFLVTSRPVNMLGSTLFVICFLLNTLFLLFFAVKVAIASFFTDYFEVFKR